jgi:arylsulfatase A-like enzyme
MAFGSSLAPASISAAEKPNVILILADDLGWTDLACYGSDLHETPNLDRLAADGMKFTQAYSACTVCSPTRASLLTGKYPARLHVTDWIAGLVPANPKVHPPEWTKHLPLEETTLAEAFKAAGYATASIDKWHLGGEPYHPEKQGFDLNLAGTEAPSPKSYFAPYSIATLPDGPPGEYLTDRIGNEAVRFIEEHRAEPFFLYFPHFAVHLPVQAPEELTAKYRGKLAQAGKETNHKNPAYAAMLDRLDHTVGQVRAKLAELKLDKRTIVIFTSDNGGRIPTTSNVPLRDGKASCHEGGTRVPLLVHWPGVTRAGSTCEAPAITPDLYPTILAMAGLAVPAAQQPDGVSLVPLLKQTGALERDALYWHYPHYQLYQLGGTTPYGAIRAGNWKFIEYYDGTPSELFDLASDLAEERNLAAKEPARAAELAARLAQWRSEVGAQMPRPNPNYDPAKPQHVPNAKAKAKAKGRP